MKKKIVALMLPVVMLLSLAFMTGCEGREKYVLYVNIDGVNDGEYPLSMPDAQKQIRDIMSEKDLQYIEHTAYGVYGEGDFYSDGNTLIYIFFDEEERNVLSAALKIKNELSAATVLMEKYDSEVTVVET